MLAPAPVLTWLVEFHTEGGVVEFLILGPLEVRDGTRVIPLGGAKPRAALAILLLNANQVVSRDRLIDGIWGGEPPASPHARRLHLAVASRSVGERGLPASREPDAGLRAQRAG